MKIRPVGAELFYAEGRADGYDEATHTHTNSEHVTLIVFPRQK
jgi:hypothetical protein